MYIHVLYTRGSGTKKGTNFHRAVIMGERGNTRIFLFPSPFPTRCVSSLFPCTLVASRNSYRLCFHFLASSLPCAANNAPDILITPWTVPCLLTLSLSLSLQFSLLLHVSLRFAFIRHVCETNVNKIWRESGDLINLAAKLSSCFSIDANYPGRDRTKRNYTRGDEGGERVSVHQLEIPRRGNRQVSLVY